MFSQTTRDTLKGGPGRGATGPFGGAVAVTSLRHTRNCGKNRDGGVATPWSATRGGGVASAPLRAARLQNEIAPEKKKKT